MRYRFMSFAVALLLGCSVATADGLESLERFIKGAKSGRSDFTQVVSAPSRRDRQDPHLERQFCLRAPGSFPLRLPQAICTDHRR